jgi:hypothetical protein
VYYLNPDGTIYTADDLVTVGQKVSDLLELYTLKQISVVKNCIIHSNITVEEAQ